MKKVILKLIDRVGFLSTAILLGFVLLGMGMGISYFVNKPSFKVGDCVVLDVKRERWDTEDPSVLKILEIGKEKYRYAYYYVKFTLTSDSYISIMDRAYIKTECAKTLE